ncbi:hypothetical protein ACFSC6_05675 [Rufibacter sediminis]|uniref:HTTM domain-containing protein n=1 Tax=Rufibacter sediminis TaxID=2762756 RepID=A0ABR6VPR2_9BACT|nr:hypothetical protein [Rufibacter sediminis]MBC3539179.1 hypothetical protein [Rufibacter sediminis]
MSIPSLSFKQAFTAQSINYYSFLKEYPSPEKYASSLLKYKIFCCVWAIASIFHMANYNGFTLNLTFFLLTSAAIALMAKPSSIARLLVFISMQMFQASLDMPGISNHWILTAFVNITILHAYVYLIIKRKSFYIDKVEFLNTFAPLVKIELIILYFYAVFHKLNAGFFDTEFSCAVRFILVQNNYYNILPSDKALLALNIYATLIIESIIPIMICIRKTRYWGLLLGLVFHFIIAYNPINGFYDFSSAVFALYFLFTSTTFSHKIQSLYNNFISRKVILKKHLLQFNLVNFALFAVSILFMLFLVYYYNKVFQDYFRHIVWTTYGLGFIIIFMLSMNVKEKNNETKTFSFAHYSLLFIPILVFLNGLCPYLGLKTESSYAMFSNLRTEAGISNHYIIPASAQIFDYQKDIVEIVSTSEYHLQNVAKADKLMTFFQFRRFVRTERPEFVTYKRNGVLKTFELSKATASHELYQKENYLLEKIMFYRYFNRNGVQECSH